MKKNPALFCLADTMSKKELKKFNKQQKIKATESKALTEKLNSAISKFGMALIGI